MASGKIMNTETYGGMMSSSKVYLIEGTRSDFETGKGFDKVAKALTECGIGEFSGKDVLVKLHMGEKGNKFYIKPPIIKRFVDFLSSLKAKPFLYDTCVKYEGGRNTIEKYAATAKEHGFDSLGCPVVIGNDGRSVKVDMKGTTDVKEYAFEVADDVCDAEYILSVAHGKGHMMSGFGGSIKAFGMGGVSKETKGFIHAAGAPAIGTHEACKACGICMKECPMGAIKVDEGTGWEIDTGKCFACQRCVKTCPNKALVWKGEEFDLMLAAGAVACFTKSAKNKDKKSVFINIVVDVAKRCDCASEAGPIISPDVGILVSKDPVAIDMASIDLISKAMGKDMADVQSVDPRGHVMFAERLGMGSAEYELEKI
jgi:uncharacterized protein